MSVQFGPQTFIGPCDADGQCPSGKYRFCRKLDGHEGPHEWGHTGGRICEHEEPPSTRRGGQPQKVLVAQGEARPGFVRRQHWVWRTWEQLPERWRLPYVVPGGVMKL